jgi:hypothetical protein
MKRFVVVPLAAFGGCVTGSFDRAVADEPIPAAVLATLQPGADTLATCLQRLGAPLRVVEYDVAADGSSGMALSWQWRDTAGWGLDVSSGDDAVPGSVSWDSESAELPGCVLWFGPDLVLERWHAGLVGDLRPGRRRPAAADGS